ncbi:MAG: preprotein translocase subunit SecE [Coriobacteriaceae bacterium]|nr:preprotein translocase subunit SecE [Coriobacteriaceae bacterium]
MANKKNTKKDEQNAAASKVESAKASKKDTAPAKKSSKAKKNEKPGFFARVKKYFKDVKSEMKRVVWPTKQELIRYSVTVCVSLILVGVVIALLDALIGQGLVLFSGLRG